MDFALFILTHPTVSCTQHQSDKCSASYSFGCNRCDSIQTMLSAQNVGSDSRFEGFTELWPGIDEDML